MNSVVSGPQFGDLPPEIRSLIFSHLSLKEAKVAMFVCRQWRTDIADSLAHSKIPETNDVRSLWEAGSKRMVALRHGASSGNIWELAGLCMSLERTFSDPHNLLRALMRAP